MINKLMGFVHAILYYIITYKKFIWRSPCQKCVEAGLEYLAF